MEKLLIANRGEIALRVMRTAERLGILTVAVHTDGDADAPHVRAADRSVRISSYLDVEEIVAAALRKGADAVHPGYGFLSERADFARAVTEAGLVFVGPAAKVIDTLGRKDAAREVALAAGVPVVPSYSIEAALADPTSIDYPVLAKASAGGGGKGMRIVRAAEELTEAVAAAQREAAAAFGDDAMLLERYVERGRHVEVQVLADQHGTVLHLWDRDCSAQRRHQKVIEEAPAPALPFGVRDLVLSSAIALARTAGYTNAGTVEFLVEESEEGRGSAYFLEMNTRLQVEHPVTEAVTGLDLVELQLRVADGLPLGLTQADVRCEGHAMEARVYAEDPYSDFLPQAGVASVVRWPEGVRVDQALESGQEVSTAFDPMLGKVVVHAADRETARQALVEALDETAIFGLTTNVGFLRDLADSEEFTAGPVDTAWLDRHPFPTPDDAPARALVGVTVALALAEAPPSPWQPDYFRVGGPDGPLIADGRSLEVEDGMVMGGDPDEDGVVHIGLVPSGGGLVRRSRGGTEVVIRGQRFDFPAADPFGRRAAVAGDGTLTAPMPGTLLSVAVEEGASVAAGQTLGVLEAMKMEVALKAPYDGVVSVVGAAAGEQVALGTVLFVVDPG